MSLKIRAPRKLPDALRRFTRWATTPGPGLGFAWFAVFIGGLASPWSAWLPVAVLLLACFTAWLSMLLVTALVPPPTPLSDESALARRLFWLLRVTWAAAIFGASALYGAIAGLDMEARATANHATGTTDIITESATDLILPVLTVVAFGCGWYAVMMCAWDLWRVGESERTRAVAGALNWLAPRLSGVDSAIPSRVMCWAGGLVLWCSTPGIAAVFGYLAPVVVIGMWNSISPSGIDSMGLF